MKLARYHFSPVAASLAAITLSCVLARAQPVAPTPVPDPLDLTTAIGFAIENNFAIRQARERIRQQEGLLVEVRARDLPNVALAASYSRDAQSLSASFSPAVSFNSERWQIGITVSQNLLGGGVRPAIKSTAIAREAAVLDVHTAINDALLAVRLSFYSVLLTREKVNVQEKNLMLLQEQLKTATDRFESGVVSNFEKLRADVAVANARVPLITARNDYRLAIETLRQALGLTTNTPESLRKTPEFVGSLDYLPTQFELQAALDAARAQRPELQRLAKLFGAREQDVRAQQAGYYPSLGVNGGYRIQNPPFKISGPGTAGSKDAYDGWSIGLQSQWAIFDGRATAGRVAQARSSLEQTKLSLAEAQLAVDVEVRRAHSQWQQATELAEASQRVTEQATESVRLANARYNAGTGTQLDVLAAQVDLTTARTNQIQAYYAYNVAIASLRKAMGQADEFVKK